ncbi:type II toxin-antitoxin system VapC family toxin [Roseomonas sp. CAU 1739]|uniref:type II toxin-antitoxin system VapC family toxin n=1 Tax=Roseomonas sp. CAU 1739 TaxID=3140364 RepID=UPI00325B6D21
MLLDTCAMIWLANGDPMAPEALAAIEHAARHQGVFVSPISAWEVGMLSRPKPGREAAVKFLPNVQTWFARVMAAPGVKEARLTARIAIGASYLPGEFHGDPGDRLIVATAQAIGVTVVTRDRSILTYSRTSSIMSIFC